MKKYSILFLTIFLGIYSHNAFSQHWDSLPGKFQNPNSVRVLYSDSNYIYLAGAFNEIGGKHIQGIGRWDGVKWDSLGTGIDGLYYATGHSFPNNTLAITEYNGSLYVGGVFGSLGNVNAPCIGKWDGVSWDSLSIQPFKINTNAAVLAMNVINDKL